jgi:hypothetical protein
VGPLLGQLTVLAEHLHERRPTIPLFERTSVQRGDAVAILGTHWLAPRGLELAQQSADELPWRKALATQVPAHCGVVPVHVGAEVALGAAELAEQAAQSLRKQRERWFDKGMRYLVVTGRERHELVSTCKNT